MAFDIFSRWLLRMGSVLLTSATLLGCASTTNSGAIGLQRSQLMLISSEAINAQAAKGFQQLTADAQSKKKLNTNPAMTQRVRRIGQDLIGQVGVFRPDARNWA